MKYDIIAGIPMYNSEKNIRHVVEQIDKGLSSYNKKALILGIDGGSKDKTKDVFLNTKTKTEKKFMKEPKGVTGKGNAFKILFRFADKVKPQVIIVNDSDLKSINKIWVRKQIDAIYAGYDYATPYYARHKNDGLITKNICYPIIYGLFGKNIRQPIGGDFAFSGKLASYWSKAKWPQNAGLFGIDIFMTTNAILGGFKICEVGLGAKIHQAKDPADDLSPMFEQVVDTLFEIVTTNKKAILKIDKLEHIKVLKRDIISPSKVKVNSKKMKDICRSAISKNKKFYQEIYSDQIVEEIKDGKISGLVWTHILYESIEAYSRTKSKTKRKQIVKNLEPLWLGRNADFVKKTQLMSSRLAESLVKKQASAFWETREIYLKHTST